MSRTNRISAGIPAAGNLEVSGSRTTPSIIPEFISCAVRFTMYTDHCVCLSVRNDIFHCSMRRYLSVNGSFLSKRIAALKCTSTRQTCYVTRDYVMRDVCKAFDADMNAPHLVGLVGDSGLGKSTAASVLV